MRILKKFLNTLPYQSNPYMSLQVQGGLSIKLGRRVLFDLFDIDKVLSNMKHNNNQEDKTANKIVGGINSNGI